eukprot:TRINITY_DN5101_c0_g1_i1.p1 TRINITY_DN5101_c0_g1~~TRINITY_DN5101_c0_g1_i1.p1  ORF type:complete len:1126 (-),score=329.09 TRINITY_DN5101_c0_g1_i1:9-3386(-)
MKKKWKMILAHCSQYPLCYELMECADRGIESKEEIESNAPESSSISSSPQPTAQKEKKIKRRGNLTLVNTSSDAGSPVSPRQPQEVDVVDFSSTPKPTKKRKTAEIAHSISTEQIHDDAYYRAFAYQIYDENGNFLESFLKNIGVEKLHTLPKTVDTPLLVCGPEEPSEIHDQLEAEGENCVPLLLQTVHESLPVISFRNAEEDPVEAVYQRPENYIEYQEPSFDEMDRAVEYDLDEEDEEFLRKYNKRRKKEGLFPITENDLEMMMDRLEKESFRYESLFIAPVPEPDGDSEDSLCVVCEDGTSDDTNQIVFCDGCDIAVHQECYGIRYIPEGRWFCQKCESKEKVRCSLCPNLGGAFKRTSDQQWAHIICALWIPETGLAMDNGMVGEIEGVDHISNARWRLVCEICKKREGACIQCSEKSCTAAFHVTCGRQAGLNMPSVEKNGLILHSAHCFKHAPKGHQHIASKGRRGGRKKKKKVDHFDQWIVPFQHADKILRKKAPVQSVLSVWEYWVHKRKSRSGNPLLKRFNKAILSSLHFNPLDCIANLSRDELKAGMVEIYSMRQSFEQARTLLELVQKREMLKRDLIVNISENFELEANPFRKALLFALNYLQSKDKHDFFIEDVNTELLPSYREQIANPMCFNTVRKRIEENHYETKEEFFDDLQLIFSNAMAFNTNIHKIHRVAKMLSGFLEQMRKGAAADDETWLEVTTQKTLGNKHPNGTPKKKYKTKKQPPVQQQLETTETNGTDEKAEVQATPSKPKKRGRASIQSTEIVPDESENKEVEPKPKRVKKEKTKPQLNGNGNTADNFDLQHLLTSTLSYLERVDKTSLFGKKSASETLSFKPLRKKLEQHQYSSKEAFMEDLNGWFSAVATNYKPGTEQFRMAKKLLRIGKFLVDNLEAVLRQKANPSKGETPTSCPACSSRVKKNNGILNCVSCKSRWHSSCCSSSIQTLGDNLIVCDLCDPSKRCSVCAEGKPGDKKNLIVCDGCDVAIHKKCAKEAGSQSPNRTCPECSALVEQKTSSLELLSKKAKTGACEYHKKNKKKCSDECPRRLLEAQGLSREEVESLIGTGDPDEASVDKSAILNGANEKKSPKKEPDEDLIKQQPKRTPLSMRRRSIPQ